MDIKIMIRIRLTILTSIFRYTLLALKDETRAAVDVC